MGNRGDRRNKSPAALPCPALPGLTHIPRRCDFKKRRRHRPFTISHDVGANLGSRRPEAEKWSMQSKLNPDCYPIMGDHRWAVTAALDVRKSTAAEEKWSMQSKLNLLTGLVVFAGQFRSFWHFRTLDL
ncbi:hypothetical protein SDJN03_03342, partial [Cucurbita argyrosperma subsp. sororia]